MHKKDIADSIGWFGYFQYAHRSTFRDVDGFARRRLRAILRKR